MENNMNVTSLDELKDIAKGKVVELSGWEEDRPFFVRLKRPSLQIMAMKGMIPNSLLSCATKLFFKDKNTSLDIAEFASLQMAIAEASLVEPSVSQLDEIGLTLTDQQLMEIFTYSQSGVNGLESFRDKQKVNTNIKPSSEISNSTI